MKNVKRFGRNKWALPGITSRFFFGFVVVLLAATAEAEVRLPSIFSDHVVLQRDQALPVWGWADPGEQVTVTFGVAKAVVTTGKNGRWAVQLAPQPASSDPLTLTVSGRNTIVVQDVLLGDVWLCSGQSNMEFGLGGCNAKEDIEAAQFPTLRRIKFNHVTAEKPADQIPGRWEICTPQSAPGFTAVGFYFARRIQKETGVPIGLIDDNWGGTRIEPWIPPSGFEMEDSLAGIVADVKKREQSYRDDLGKALDPLEQWIVQARKALATNGAELPVQPQIPGNPYNDASFPSSLYNGMIHPIVPFGIKGAIWYQGESNGGEGDEYYAKMRALIGGWRKLWAQGDFPFYFVQLANFTQPNDDPAGGDGWARVRMAQLKSLEIPKTGMAVAIDLADADNPNDIHPKNKFDVGERLALWALARDYGKGGLVCSGPLYRSMKVEGDKVHISFASVGGGLMAARKEGREPAAEDASGKLKRFAIAGADRKWFWADAIIDGDTVIVSSPKVPAPVAVRYGYSMNPAGCNLYNREGLPASPFRTDNW
ncbi:MAG: sialate O-acetylesterase [Verrucomicrobiota bacterium]